MSVFNCLKICLPRQPVNWGRSELGDVSSPLCRWFLGCNWAQLDKLFWCHSTLQSEPN